MNYLKLSFFRISLFFLSLIAMTFYISFINDETKAASSGVYTENAEIKTSVLVTCPDILFNLYSVEPRFLVDDADSISSLSLSPFSFQEFEPSRSGSSSSARIMTENVESISTIELHPFSYITNTPPVAKAGLDQDVTVNELVSLDGSASYDNDGTITAYEWDFGDGESGEGKTVTHTYTSIDDYTVTLTVTDSNEGTSTDTITVNVNRENDPPIISTIGISEDRVIHGSVVTLKAEVYDPDKDILSFRWEAQSGNIKGAGPTATWSTPEKGGTYYITLEITDGYGGSDRFSMPVQVISEKIVTSKNPQEPYVNLYGHKTDVVLGEEVILSLSAINPITSPGNLIIQLTLKLPHGWSITSRGFGHGDGGLYTNAYEIEQGPTERSINVNILANQPFEGYVEGMIDYYFEEDKDTKYHDELSVHVTAEDPHEISDETSLLTDNPEKASPKTPGGCEKDVDETVSHDPLREMISFAPIGVVWISIAGGYRLIKRKKR